VAGGARPESWRHDWCLQPSGRPSDCLIRQEEAATLVAQGFSNRCIASELSISEDGGENHLPHILRSWSSPLGLSSPLGQHNNDCSRLSPTRF
jgi:hypothetical protein